MPTYYVISRQWDEVVPALDYGQGPTEPCWDVWYGEAGNRSLARQFAYRDWRRKGAKSLRLNRENGKHPMAGSKVVGEEEYEQA